MESVRGLDILDDEKREELGGAAPFDREEVVISSGGRISAKVRGGNVSPSCCFIAGRVELRVRGPGHTSINDQCLKN